MDEQLSDAESPPPPAAKAELVDRIKQSRAALEQRINALSDEQLVAPASGSGWSVKDHLAHLAVWELSLVALLQGRSRAAATGLDEATYQRGADGAHAVNEIVYQRDKDRGLADVLADFRQSGQGVLAVLNGLTDDDLIRTYSHYQPNEPGDDTGAPIVGWIAGNTYKHYDEHRESIEALAR